MAYALGGLLVVSEENDRSFDERGPSQPDVEPDNPLLNNPYDLTHKEQCPPPRTTVRP